MHNVDETGPRIGDAYLVCYECNHAYNWRGSLWLAEVKCYIECARFQLQDVRSLFGYLRGTAAWWRGLLRTVMLRPSKVYSCPNCSHDF